MIFLQLIDEATSTEATTTPPEAPPVDLTPPQAPDQALMMLGLPVAGTPANVSCDYYTPKAVQKVGGGTAYLIFPNQDNANFAFASSSCVITFPAQNNASSSIYEEIRNPASTTQSFFLEKTLTYGDILIVIFLTLGFYFLLGKSLFNFFLKKWH